MLQCAGSNLFDGVLGIIWHDQEDFSIPELSHYPFLLPALRKHNRGKELQLQANNYNNNLIPRSKLLPAALTASLIPTPPHGLYLGGLLRYTKVHPTMFGS